MIKKTVLTVGIGLMSIQSIFAQTLALNLAKYQATTSSGAGSSIPSQFATDGFVSMDNRWGVFTSGPHWLEVTLATPMTIGSSHLYLGAPWGDLISNFVLQYHDGSSWVDIPGATVTGNSLPVRNIEFSTPVTAQTFRLYTTDSNPQVKEMALYAPTADGSPVPLGSDLDLNVAKMRQYAYSSVSGSNYPKLAFDGYVDDSSAWASANVAGPHDLEIHLAQNEVIHGIHLYSGTTGVAGSQIEDFEVAYHDGSNWVLFDGGSVSGNTELNRVVMFNTAVSTLKIRIRSLDSDQAVIREFVVLPDDGGTGYPLWTDASNEAPPALSFLDYEDSYFTIENRSTGLHLSSSTIGSFTTSDESWFQVLLNLGTDTYRLRSKETEACFEVAMAATNEGAAVVEGTYSSMPHQRWRLEDVDGTHVRIVNVWSGMVLGLDGTNVVQQASGSETSKQWKINYETHYPKQGQAAHFHFSSMFKPSWCYDWRKTPKVPVDFPHMPMQWAGIGSANPEILRYQSEWYGRARDTTVLGFNEPDLPDQANMTEETAAYQWPRLERMRMPLAGPVPAAYKGSWRQNYEAMAEEQGLRSEYMAVHWYAISGASSGSPSTLINNMEYLYNLYGKPIWLTEFSTRNFNGILETWSRNHNYNYLAEFAWRAETLPWLKKWSLFEWGNSGGDPATTDAGSDDPTDMNSPRLALHHSNDSTDPGWEDLTECGLFLAGWDGNTNTVDETAYIIHNKGRFLRLIDHPASNTVSSADVENRRTTEQFMLQTAPNGNKYIVGLSDGRRLSCDGSSVGLAAANTTGTSVEWEMNDYQYGWVYIDHPSTGKRLRITDANEIDVTNDSDTYDNVRFRFIKHYNPISLTEVQTLPYAESFENGVGAWREFDNASARFWEVGSGGTPTAGAGPSGASDGEQYLFSEGHDAGSYVTNTVECIFDFSTVADVELLFDYHMCGTYINFLSLDVLVGTSWVTDVWKKTGQQHAGSDVAWSTAVLDLSSYAGHSEVTLRFRTANKQWNAADPAIDHIRIANSAYNYAPVAIAQDVTAIRGVPGAITLSGSDVDGDDLDYSFVQPTNGTLTGVAPNLTYTTTSGSVGSDSFTFTVNDGEFDSAPATVTIVFQAQGPAAGVLIDNITRNGSFEYEGGTEKLFVEDGTVNSWQTWNGISTASNDTGASVPDSPLENMDGTRRAYFQPGGAILNMTDYVMKEGDVIDYSLWNLMITAGQTRRVEMSLVWDNGGSMEVITGSTLLVEYGTQGVGAPFTVQAGDAWVGKALGLGIADYTADDAGQNWTYKWPAVDQVYLEVTSAVNILPVTDLAIPGVINNGTQIVLSWTGQDGATYSVQTNSTLLIAEGWNDWLTSIDGETGAPLSVTNDIGPDHLFYRVISE